MRASLSANQYPICSSPVSVELPEGKENAVAELGITATPDLNLRLELLGIPARQDLVGEEIRLTFPNQRTVTAMPFRSASDGWSCALLGKDPIVIGETAAGWRSASFDLFNFPEARYKSSHLEWEELQLELIPEQHHHDPNVRHHLSDSRFVKTHSARLESRKGEISFSDSVRLREGLHLFFSFCRGAFTGPLNFTAFGPGSEKVWEMHGNPLVSPNPTPRSWFDSHRSESLNELLPGFWSLWKDETWVTPLRRAVYWYSRSCSRKAGADTSIILAQCGLEVLSWARLVSSAGVLTQEDFARLKAAGQLRLLLGTEGIPLAVPDALPELLAISREFNTDGPGSLALVRNSIVHPPRKGADSDRSAKLERATFDASNLAIHYLELTMLALCAYRGEYGNRLTKRYVGEVERVPWAV